MGRMASFFGASSSGTSGRSRGNAAGSSGAPDFLAQSEDPDKRRLADAQSRSRGAGRQSRCRSVGDHGGCVLMQGMPQDLMVQKHCSSVTGQWLGLPA